jgi:hypothetical protein
MLWNASSLRGYSISASDGEIGSVTDLLFDDAEWTVRWAVVDTGTWLPGRKVLLPPHVLGVPDVARRTFSVALTRDQVKDSPDVDTDRPVSRVEESDVFGYYGWEPYWLGYPYAATAGIADPLPPGRARPEQVPGAARRDDPHLRSVEEVTGYYVHAADGDIGHVEDFLLDDAGWAVRYLVVDTRNWWPGKKTLVLPQAFRSVDWTRSTIATALTRDRIKQAPEYDPDLTVDRAYEERFHQHYGYAGYWV